MKAAAGPVSPALLFYGRVLVAIRIPAHDRRRWMSDGPPSSRCRICRDFRDPVFIPRVRKLGRGVDNPDWEQTGGCVNYSCGIVLKAARAAIPRHTSAIYHASGPRVLYRAGFPDSSTAKRQCNASGSHW